MKTLSLAEAYKLATPGPLEVFISDGREDAAGVFILTQRTPEQRMGQARTPVICAMGVNAEANAALLCHSFNVLPEVVAALQTIADAGERGELSIATIHDIKSIARKALSKSLTVKIP